MRPNTRTVMFSTLLAGITAFTAPVQAMTSGTPADGDGHPATVVLLVSNGYRARPFCSGTLLSGKVVLSASHCLSPALEWQRSGRTILVSNDPTLQENAEGWLPTHTLATRRIVSQIVVNPAYNPRLLGGYAHDVSAAVLAEAIIIDPASLPALPPVGVLDQLKASKYLRTATFTVLGYGDREKLLPSDTDGSTVTAERRVGELGLDALEKSFIHQSQRIAQGEGGACYGDSGGPSLLRLGQTDYVVGVTSSGDAPCFATNTATRTDTAEANALLSKVLAANPDD